MDGQFHYANTDLDLVSAVDLTELARAFEAGGCYSLNVTHDDDGQWRASFETDEQYTEPEPNIATMLDAIEALSPQLRSVWQSCSLREFNLGYNCGLEPWAYMQRLSTELVGRIQKAGASLALTLYPARDSEPPAATVETEE